VHDAPYHLRVPLLERDRPLAELLAAAERAVDGAGGVAVVVGEAGIGKTALLHELAANVSDRMRVLWAGCEALFTPRPLGPLHDIAPDLEIDTDAPRERLFPSALAAAQRIPTLLVVEDVHWADHATLDFLKYIARRIARAPLLLALSYRDDEIAPDHPLISLLGEAGTVVRRVALTPLSRETVEQIANGRAGVFELTGGNPFYVTEVLATDADAVPPIVRDAVLARAAKLSAEARQLVEMASVVPRRAELELLAASEEASEEAARCGIVRIDGQAIVFRHELARQAMESSLSDLRRAALHRIILARLIERGDASLARVAHHAAGAEDAAAIFDFAPLAAAEAAKAGAHFEAASHLRAALRHAKSADACRAVLLESLAYECALTDDSEEALACRIEATEIRRRLGDKLREGDNVRWQSRFLWRLGRSAEARKKSEEAIAILEGQPSRELAMAYNNQSQFHMLAQEKNTAIEWGTLAMELATQLGDNEIIAHALNSIGSAYAMAYDLTGLAKIEEALRLSLQHGFQEHAARSYGNLAALSVWLRQYVRAEHAIAEGLEYCQERDIIFWQNYITVWRARLLLERGRWDDAAADANAVLAGHGIARINRAFALVIAATVRARHGDPDAQPMLDEAQDLARRMPDLQRIGVVAIARAEAAWLRGDFASAIEELRAAHAFGGRMIKRHDLDRWIWRAGGSKKAPPPREGAGDPYDEALLLSDAGDIDSLQRAIATLEQLGDNCLIHTLRQRLRDRGVRGPRVSTRAHPAGLTAREVEILELINEGLRNVDIAQRLHVSPKTVDHHVSSVLAKLNVRSRGEAARLYRSQMANSD